MIEIITHLVAVILKATMPVTAKQKTQFIEIHKHFVDCGERSKQITKKHS